jgi:hypothetical protein
MTHGTIYSKQNNDEKRRYSGPVGGAADHSEGVWLTSLSPAR